MSIGINGVSSNNELNTHLYGAATQPGDNNTISGDRKESSDISVKNSDQAASAAESEKTQNTNGVVYEKGSTEVTGLYSKMQMSKADRSALVNQLKADMEEQKQQLMNLVHKTLAGQVGTYGKATGNDIWKTLAGGNFTVDAATKAQAQKEISEDGYWGVKKTSQRLFDFASALAGDDVDKMKEMQKAMEKGFKMATKAWGRELPSISRDTLDAANKLFEDYYRSKDQTENIQSTANA